MIYAFAALAFHQLNRNDTHQDRLLVLGIVLGSWAPLATLDVRSVKTFLPVSVTLALTVSALTHWIWRCYAGQRARKWQAKIDQKQDRGEDRPRSPIIEEKAVSSEQHGNARI